MLLKSMPEPDACTPPKRLNILVLCTGNSARSIMAEALFNHLAGQRFHAFSAGSNPTGRVNSYAVDQLRGYGIDSQHFHSKSWLEFTKADSPNIDVILTVCSNAAEEVCPIFPGEAVQVHWGLPDPAAVAGTPEEISLAFSACCRKLHSSIDQLIGSLTDECNNSDIASSMHIIWSKNQIT